MVDEGDEQFMRFWNLYPKRVAKKDARKAWSDLHPDAATVDAIESALRWQIEQPDWRKDGGRFIPYPSTWLRAERWHDERPKVTAAVLSQNVADPMRAWLEQKKVSGL